MFSIEVDWMGLALPFAYLLVLSVSLMTFSSIYRKRKASTCISLAMRELPQATARSRS